MKLNNQSYAECKRMETSPIMKIEVKSFMEGYAVMGEMMVK
jgi:hypothetical protein